MGIRKRLRGLPDGLPKKMLKRAIAFLPPGIKFGRKFSRVYSEIEASQWWSKGRLLERQEELLAALIQHAYENVPYYRRIFDERGLRPSDVTCVDDLVKLPILTKAMVKANAADLKAKGVDPSACEEVHTSGSSGVPMAFLADDGMMSAETAFIMRAFESHGSRLYQDKSVWLRSYVPKEGEPLCRYEPQRRLMYLSAYHLSERVLKQYVDLMEDFGSDLLVGYPSSLYAFALLLKKARMRPPRFKVAHAGSECLLPEWKSRTEEVLGCPVKDHYGMAEMVSLFHRCSESDLYHENIEYGVTEIVDVKDGVGEVVGTSLRNYAMPLIRYRMGDRARLHDGIQKCSCGRGLPLRVSAFEGRADDIIQTPDRRYLPGVNFYTLMYKTPGVGMFRIVQHSLEKIEVQVVPGAGFTPRSEARLTEGMKERVGDGMEVKVSVLNEIKRNASTGKFKTIESRIGKRQKKD
jgi:phenylacetate-CoA ligase